MKTRGGGVSKSKTYNWARRQHQLPANLLERWNSNLVIRSPVRERHQSQSSIRSFFWRSIPTPTEPPGPSQSHASHDINVDGSNHVQDVLPSANHDVPMIGVISDSGSSPEPQIASGVNHIQSSQPVHSDLPQSHTSDQHASLGLKGLSNVDNADVTHAANQCTRNNLKVFEEEQLSLLNRVDPFIPGPLLHSGDDYHDAYADGWSHIDKMSVMDCVLCPFQAIEEVPNQYRELFASAMHKIITRVWENQEEGEELDRALKWWFLIPHALLRKAGRGGKAGMGQIKKRFDCIAKENYAGLLTLLIHDKEAAKNKEERRKNRGLPEEDSDKKTRQAVSLISRGFISKASNRMISHGVASLDDPRSKAALQSKYPSRGKQMPASVTKGQAVHSMQTLRDAFLKLRGGVAPGTGQLRPEFLITLAEVWEEDDGIWECVNNFAMRHVQGTFPPWYYKMCMTVETVGMYKTAGQDPSLVRPIGMRNPWIKTIHKEVVRQNKHTLTAYLEPQQLGMSVAGGAKLVHSVRMVLEQNPEFICVKLDFKNAFNEVFRARVVEALEEEDSLRHLASHAATLLAPASALESKGFIWGESHEGTTQGDPESGPYFCIAIHKYVRNVDRELSVVGGCARFGWDDGYLLGPPDNVFTSLEKFSSEVQVHCGLELQMTKTEILIMDGTLPENTPVGMVRAGVNVEDIWEPGMLCYGVPIGSDKYVHYMLDAKVSEVEEHVHQIENVLQNEKQSLWSILRSSISQKLDYWLTLCYPTHIKQAASRMDILMTKILEKLVDAEIPMQGTTMDWTCRLPIPVETLKNRSFQHWVIRQPVKMGGLGLRSCAETSLAAFIGGLEQALPHFTGKDGVCQQLETVIGDCSGEHRWQPLLQSGCRTGRELSIAWTTLKEEAQQCSAYLGQDTTSALLAQVEDAGDGSTDGSTRKKLIMEKEELRGAVMTVALSRLPNPHQRASLAWLNRDKLSSAWLSSLPGPEGLSSQAFAEAMSLILCMPSPACKYRVGAKVGKRTVDPFGDSILAEALPGDHWRTRHDKMKMAINSLCTWARLPVTCEVWGLFSHLISGEALSRFEAGRKRQALVPDFRLEVPCSTGGTVYRLAELKMICCCDTWYKPAASSTVRGTDKRALGLQTEYRRKAKKVDDQMQSARGDQKGPVERRLDEFGELIGLCFGAWGEASEDIHWLIQIMAESRLQSGRSGNTKQELGILVGQIRRRLSLAAIKAQVECLLSRLHQVGPGNKQLAKKREWAAMEDERMRRERSAQWMRKFEGVQTLRKGFIKTA